MDYSQGTVVCTYCGLVQEKTIIDESCELRQFAQECSGRGIHDQRRTGQANNLFLSDQGMATFISQTPTGYKSLIKSAQWIAQSNEDKKIKRGFSTISNFTSHLSLSEEVEEEAKKIFKVVIDANGHRGHIHESIVAACIFKACRAKRSARSVKQLALMACVDWKKLQKSLSKISRVYKDSSPCILDEVITQFAKEISRDLHYPIELQRAAVEVGRRAHRMEIVAGKNPVTIAGSAAYMVGLMIPKYRKTISIVSEAARMKPITIKSCARAMFKSSRELLTGLFSENAICALNKLFS